MRELHRYAFWANVTAVLGAALLFAGCAGAPSIDDGFITSRVKRALGNDRAVSSLAIAVETFNGSVQLSGFANNQAEISRAVELASDVRGVRSVNNEIRLKTAGDRR